MSGASAQHGGSQSTVPFSARSDAALAVLEIWDRGVNASGRCTAECQARPSLRSVWEAQRGGLGRLLTYQKPEMINGQGSWRYPP